MRILSIFNFFRRKGPSAKELRLEAHRKWLRKHKVMFLAKPKSDSRSSIEMHQRIMARQ